MFQTLFFCAKLGVFVELEAARHFRRESDAGGMIFVKLIAIWTSSPKILTLNSLLISFLKIE